MLHICEVTSSVLASFAFQNVYYSAAMCAQFAVVHSLFALFLVKVYGLYRWGKPRHVSETWGKTDPAQCGNHSHPRCRHWGSSSGHSSGKSVVCQLSSLDSLKVQFNLRSVVQIIEAMLIYALLNSHHNVLTIKRKWPQSMA